MVAEQVLEGTRQLLGAAPVATLYVVSAIPVAQTVSVRFVDERVRYTRQGPRPLLIHPLSGRLTG